jgi:hypothetical protein
MIHSHGGRWRRRRVFEYDEGTFLLQSVDNYMMELGGRWDFWNKKKIV